MSIGDELHKLQQLHQSGGLSDQEFATAKARLLDAPHPARDAADAPGMPPAEPAYLEKQARQWGMFLHLSIFAGYVSFLLAD